jgi:opacity protein-like surface antigen
MRFIFALLAMAALAVSPAMAADDGGFYVGAGFGSLEIDIDDFEEGADFTGQDTAYKLFGGWKFNKYIGGELEWIDGGTAEEKYTTGVDTLKAGIDVSGFNLSLLGAFPIGEQFDVFAKLGLFNWNADVDANISGPLCDELIEIGESCKESASDDGTDFSWGVGANWYFMENFGARAEYQSFEVDEATADSWFISVLWMF